VRAVRWPPLVLALGACASAYLLLERAEAAVLWVLVPLALWFIAASRLTVGLLASVIQAAVIALIALSAGGHLAIGAWTPSFWDAVIAYTLIALLGWAAVERDQREQLRLRRYRAPTPARKRIAKVTAIMLPGILLLMCCAGSVLAVQTHPVKPPDELVYPLPDGLSVTNERTWCSGPWPAVECTWSIDVDSWKGPSYLRRDQLTDHLSNAKGWPSNLSEKQCRAWGWIVKEHACLMVELREVQVPMPIVITDPSSWGDRAGVRLQSHLGGWYAEPFSRLTIHIDYW
jgi:hypothetical protein